MGHFTFFNKLFIGFLFIAAVTLDFECIVLFDSSLTMPGERQWISSPQTMLLKCPFIALFYIWMTLLLLQ